MTEPAPDPASRKRKGAGGRRKGPAAAEPEAVAEDAVVERAAIEGRATEEPAVARGTIERDAPAPEAAPEDGLLEAEADVDDDRPIDGIADKPAPSVAELLTALQQVFAGETIPPGLLERYAEHAHLLLEGNRRLNLTAILDPKEVAVKHYFDCWRAIRLLPLMGRSVLDLGTGGGFPGVPIALGEPAARVVVLDSRAKRVEFNREVIERMRIPNATAVCDRGEDHLQRNTYDVVFLRALSSVRENVRLLRKVRHRFEDLVMFKGPSWSREVRAAEREAERLGFRLDTVWEYQLPHGMGDRALLVYRAPGGR
jgi:16S rRNA (guanine527-N7)-methyltransferase